MRSAATRAGCTTSSTVWSRPCWKHVKQRGHARTSPRPIASATRSLEPACCSKTPRPAHVGSSPDGRQGGRRRWGRRRQEGPAEGERGGRAPQADRQGTDAESGGATRASGVPPGTFGGKAGGDV